MDLLSAPIRAPQDVLNARLRRNSPTVFPGTAGGRAQKRTKCPESDSSI